MHVKMRHFLMAVPANVGNHPIATVSDSGDLGHLRDHAGEGGLFLVAGRGRKVPPVNIGTLWNDQNMDSAQRRDILERQRVVILGNLVTGNFPAQDFRKDVAVVIGHHFSSFW